MAGPNDRSRYSPRRKPRWGTLALVAALHVLAIIGLARAFAPDLTTSAVEKVASVLSVTISAPEKPEAPPEPDEGAAGEEGRKATPRETSAPETRIALRPVDLPEASSTGEASRSGARQAGEGTGAGGEGGGTGNGNAGMGQGSGLATRAVKIAGDINSAADYPVPPGGRQARFGTSVTIAITVGRDGLPKACRVHAPSPFPETDRITCELAMARFRFRPATNRRGEPVESVFGWRQEFRRSD